MATTGELQAKYLALYVAGNAPLAEVWNGEYGCATMAFTDADWAAQDRENGYGRSGVHVYLRKGYAPAVSGFWMDFPEDHWGLTDDEYYALDASARAALECTEQATKYVNSQFTTQWVETYHPHRYNYITCVAFRFMGWDGWRRKFDEAFKELSNA